MTTLRILAAAAAMTFCATASFAEAIMIKDAYARAARPNAPVGAAFMMLMNHSAQDDVLVAASSPIAKRVELHTHIETGDGIMQMTEIEGGIVVPAGGMHMLKRGGDHVMLMGLTESLEQGGTVSLTLRFEKAGDITVDVPVDNERKDAHMAH